MRRLTILLILLISSIIIATPLVKAECQIECTDCADTIKVIPVGSIETGEPLIATSPADLMIFHTGQGPIKNVWLLIVLNEPTYNNLDQITINGTTFMTKSDFQLVTTKKIPPESPNTATGYPGSNCQYEVKAIKSKMNETGNPIYYGVKYFLPQITKDPTYFTLAVKLTAPADLKALILALGRYDKTSKTGYGTDCVPCNSFNRCSSYSKSTLVVSDPTTLALTLAPLLGVASFYTIKRKKN